MGEILFHACNLNSFAYKQILKFYREDLNKYSFKIFQQDEERNHSDKLSLNMIKFFFKDRFIPALDNDLKINDENVPHWLPNSHEFSHIQIIYSIVKQMLVFFPHKDINDLKNDIKLIWESIPKTICENIIEYMKYRWVLYIKYKGRRLNKELLRKIQKINKHFKWKMNALEINGKLVKYNDKFIQKFEDIREKKRSLAEQKRIEKREKEKMVKLLRLKPKEYKNISKKKKKI